MLQKSPAWENENKVIGVVTKRPKNLGSMILLRRKRALDSNIQSQGTSRCTPLPQPGEKRKVGRPCTSCGMMSGSNSITSKTTGRPFRTPSASCKSRNIVYCASCQLCEKQYVGQSVNRLQKRISGHRTHLRDTDFDETDEATLAEHLKLDHNFNTLPLFNSSYSFTVLELDPKHLDNSEQRWVSLLLTMRPFGLNKETPRGVTDSVSTMCRRSLGLIAQRY